MSVSNLRGTSATCEREHSHLEFVTPDFNLGHAGEQRDKLLVLGDSLSIITTPQQDVCAAGRVHDQCDRCRVLKISGEGPAEKKP